MFIVDTHAHLNFRNYDIDRDAVIQRSLKNSVWLINVGCDYSTSSLGIVLAQKYPEGIFAAVGLHPTNVVVGDAHAYDADVENEKEIFNSAEYRELALSSNNVVAIGETGLDYYRLREGEDADEIKKAQQEIFKEHIELAIDLQKSIIIHVRDAFGLSKAHADVLEILNFYIVHHAFKLRGAIHSFSGTVEQAKKYRALGFKISFNGIITFSRDYDEVIRETPLEDILLETDCPFLTPEPYRGKRNEPSYIVEVAKKVAELKNVSYEKIAETTLKNAERLFKLV